EPRLLALRPPRREARHLVVRLEWRQERRADERRAEGGIAPASAGVRRELRDAPRLDRAADGGVALLVRRTHAHAPVGRRLDVLRQVRDGAAGVPRRDLDGQIERLVAELREPEALLQDEVEREPV